MRCHDREKAIEAGQIVRKSCVRNTDGQCGAKGNDLLSLCLKSSLHLGLPQPSNYYNIIGR